MAIKDCIKEARLQKGYSQEELGKMIGVAKQTIQKYENGIISNIPSDKVEALAKALSTTPIALMGWEEDYTPQKPPARPVFKEPLKTAVNLFQQLDTADQNKVIGRMETMLEDKKYQAKKQAQKA